MRIDRIRITSLASLHGIQPTVDLTGPLLGQAGLVAITGPTGSGKSTLLDGLSLAIFGRTPRLDKDTDHLLSRDAVEGAAEITLTLDDGTQWVASWHAHRSRRQLDGAVQAATHQVVRVADGTVIATGSKAVKEWVERYLRLSFDQFRGVMLLAQFDFARFLGATDNDRSQLLEKLTGTDLYAKLSTAAFDTNKLAQEQVQQHQLELAALSTLSAAALAAIEAAILSGESTVAVADGAFSSAQTTTAWWRERIRLVTDCVQRQEALRGAAEQAHAAEPLRQRLATAEAALQFQPVVTALDEARTHKKSAQTALRERVGAHGQAVSELQQQNQELAQAVVQLTTAAQRAEASAKIVRTLAEMPDAALQPVREALLQVRERTSQLSESHRVEGIRKTAFSQAESVHAAAVLAHEKIAGAVVSAKQKLADATANRSIILDGSDAAAVGEQFARAHEATALAQVLTALDVSGAAARLAHSSSALLVVRGQVGKAAQALALAVDQFALAEGQKQQAETFAAVANFSHLVQPGLPCPLCGALEHPLPAVNGASLVKDAVTHLTTARSQRSHAEKTATQANSALSAAQAEVVVQTTAHQRCVDEVQLGRERWRALVAGLPSLPAEPDVTVASALAESLTQRVSAIREAERVYVRATDELQAVSITAAKADLHVATVSAQQQQAHVTWRESGTAVAQVTGELAAAQLRIGSAVNAIVLQLGESQPEDVPTWFEQLPARIVSARTCVEHIEMLRRADADEGALARSRLLSGTELPPPVELPSVELPAERDLRSPIVQVRRVADLHLAADGALKHCAHAVSQAQAVAQEAESVSIEREAQLVVSLAATVFGNESALRAVLLPTAELLQLRTRIQQVQQAEQAAHTEMERAARAVEAHLVPGGFDVADPQGAVQAETALVAALAQRDLARAHLERDRQTLAEDLRRHGARRRIEAEAGPLLAAAQRAATLSELIGSHNGARFRRFAQALTLDQLVVLANQRLMALAPRYQLIRTHAFIGQDPSLGLEIIDLEQAEAQRPVATLSGGEMFLVSLGLALALADLKRGGLRIGTLFIDEGFGSLDPCTLERCLAILERLQQEQGTQIIVISHVGALHERLAHRIEVRPQGNGRSRLRISGPEGIDDGDLSAAGSALSSRSMVAVDAELLYQALAADGTALSSRTLRKSLGWDEDSFKGVVSRLIGSGRIEQPANTKSLRRRLPGAIEASEATGAL